MEDKGQFMRFVRRRRRFTLKSATQHGFSRALVAYHVSKGDIVRLARGLYGKDQRESSLAFYSVKWNRLDTSAYIDYDVTGSFEARLTDADQPGEEPRLTILPFSYADTPASEEQQSSPKASTTLKWKGRFVNE